MVLNTVRSGWLPLQVQGFDVEARVAWLERWEFLLRSVTVLHSVIDSTGSLVFLVKLFYYYNCITSDLDSNLNAIEYGSGHVTYRSFSQLTLLSYLS